jgi:hypothetical protein
MFKSKCEVSQKEENKKCGNKKGTRKEQELLEKLQNFSR